MALTDKEIDIINIAVDKSLKKFLIVAGWDLDEPKEIRSDIAHLKRSKRLCRTFANKYVVTLAGIAATATMGVAWFAFTTVLKSGGL